MRSPVRSLVSLAAGLVLLAAASAQETLDVRGPSPATIKLGDSSSLELVIEGSSGEPRPPEVPKVDGLTFEVSPQASRQSFTYFDGRSMLSRNTATFSITVRPLREGSYTIPPLRVWTGTKEQQTRALRLDVVKDMRGEEFGYMVASVPHARVYVHEPVRFRVEFGVDAGLRPVEGNARNGVPYFDFEVQAPWLSKLDGAEAIETEDSAAERAHVVLNNSLQSAELDPEHERGGKRYRSFVFERSFLPTRAGKVQLPAPLLRYHVILREGRSIFGERVATQHENYYVYGKPLAFEVLPIPDQGRPTPYYGAVGRFQIAAQIDRDTVKVGGSVKLVVTIRGQGNLEFLRAPEFPTVAGFYKLGQTEKRRPDAVTVTYDLRVTEPDVKALPAVAWNYFDTTPGVEAFREIHTEPLPITVRPLEKGETLAALPDSAPKAVTPGVDDVFDLVPLEGAAATRSVPGALVAWLATLLPWAVVIVGALLTTFIRRRRGDVLGARARGAARTCERSLAAGGDPVAALAAYLGDRLGLPAAAMIGHDVQERLLAANAPAELASAVVAALEAGIAARYAGTAATAGLDAAAVRELVTRLEPLPLAAARRSGGAARALVLFALLPCLVSVANAQDPTAAARAAFEAYRKGDYAAAATTFEQLATAGDRRAYFDLGNACFRQGELARARWAYECARLGMPRSPDLAANLALVQKRLELGDAGGEPFLTAVAALRDSLHAYELIGLGALCHLLAAFGLVVGWRRPTLRLLGAVCLLPALLITVEVLVLAPARPVRGIALQKIDLVAEPREGKDLAKVASLSAGAAVEVVGRSDSWVLVQADGRRGYALGKMVAEVR